MARSDPSAALSEQYITLSRTAPRRMVATAPPAEDTPPEPAEAEWSLRRIERRVGSVA